jgi:hypothetical protein
MLLASQQPLLDIPRRARIVDRLRVADLQPVRGLLEGETFVDAASRPARVESSRRIERLSVVLVESTQGRVDRSTVRSCTSRDSMSAIPCSKSSIFSCCSAACDNVVEGAQRASRTHTPAVVFHWTHITRASMALRASGCIARAGFVADRRFAHDHHAHCARHWDLETVCATSLASCEQLRRFVGQSD